MKKDNKGFSLVELIVVVLIMGILAVALTPQVLKWVNNSRIATDRSLMDSIVSNCQTAMTNKAAYDIVKDKEVTIIIKDVATSNHYATIKIGSGTASNNATDAFSAKLAEYSGYASFDDLSKDVKTKASGNWITITISDKGKVTGAYQAGGAGSQITLDNE